MPLIETRGAGSAQGFGEFAQSAAPVYIEDVFSTYLYTGNGSTQTITNGIDLSGKGGLVWIKSRSNALDNAIYDTARGNTKVLFSNVTVGDSGYATTLTAFNSNGFSVDKPATGTAVGVTNTNAYTYVSWTFRKQAKFFDIVTWTGNGANRTIAHNLGSVPGCIIIKRTDTTANWAVYHRSLANTQYMVLNTTAAAATGATWWNSTTPTSTVFSLGTDATVNANGATYVAYIFAHNAGGFGLSGTDNVISCGSFTTDVAGAATVTLGYEPQWAMVKISSGTGDWLLKDNMRGTPVGTAGPVLYPNLSSAEANFQTFSPNATGFTISGLGGSSTYIYIAIRRGPMKVPTSGTSVFAPVVSNAADGTQLTAGFPVDMQMFRYRDGSVNTFAVDRLRGVGTTTTTVSTPQLRTNLTDAETNTNGIATNWNNTGFAMPSGFGTVNDVFWNFRRAPGFFDVVCFTGNNGAAPFAHNLGVKPELLFIKRRNVVADWEAHFNYGSTNYGFFYLNQASAKQFDVAAPTATTFSPFSLNTNTAVAYLFATVAGVSKVGSYTGSGTTKQIDCGFTAGARFVLIKRTDSTGDWYVWDTARGIVSGNDPYLLLNSTAAEVTSTDYVDTYSAGFELSSTAPAGLNANGGSFIFFAVA